MAQRLEELAASLQQVPVPSHAPETLSPSTSANNALYNETAEHFGTNDGAGILENIKSAQDLADFNSFMISLGKDVTSNLAVPKPVQQYNSSNEGQSPYSSESSITDQSAGHDMFDHATLASLGLAGMPGIPGPSNVNGSHHNVNVDFGNLTGSRTIAALPGSRLHRNRLSESDLAEMSKRALGIHHNARTPGTDTDDDDGSTRSLSTSLSAIGGYGTLHGLGSNDMFNPTSMTHNESQNSHGNAFTAPQGLHHSMNKHAPDTFASFDQLARPRNGSAAVPAAKLDVGGFGNNAYRNVNLLGASARTRFPSAPPSSLDILTAVCESEIEKRDMIKEEEEVSPISNSMARASLPLETTNPGLKLPALDHAENPAEVHLMELKNLNLPHTPSEYDSEDGFMYPKLVLPSLRSEKKRSYEEALSAIERMDIRGRPSSSPTRHSTDPTRLMKHASIIQAILLRVNQACKHHEEEDLLRTPVPFRNRVIKEEEEEEEEMDIKPDITLL